MGDLCDVKRVCGFNISSTHFSMMILPYINKETKAGKKVVTILEGNLEKNIRQVLSKITISSEVKEKIFNIDWKDTDIRKSNIERKLKIFFEENNDVDIVVYGCEKYINITNEIINKVISKSSKVVEGKSVKIIDCYSVNDFNENIREILDKHDIMFNTSGEHSIEEVFKGYHSA